MTSAAGCLTCPKPTVYLPLQLSACSKSTCMQQELQPARCAAGNTASTYNAAYTAACMQHSYCLGYATDATARCTNLLYYQPREVDIQPPDADILPGRQRLHFRSALQDLR